MFTIRALPRSIPRTSTNFIRQVTPFQSRFVSMAGLASNEKMNKHVVDTIIQDHREIEQYYNNILNAKDNDEATRWQNQFTWELARHSIGEELVVYPAFASSMGESGQQMADKDRAEHQTVKEDLKKFQNLKAGSPEFIPTLKQLWSHLSEHIKEEEEHDLPLLRQNIDEAEGLKLAKSFGRTKAFVPSRSHPSAPSKPPFETVVGLLTAPIDHLGDLFRKFPEDSDGEKHAMPNPSTK